MKFIHVINIILCMTKLHVRCCHHFVSVLVITLCLSLSSVLSSLCVCPCHQCCHHFVSVLVICVCYLFTGQFYPLNSLEQIEPILAKMLFDGCQHLYDYRFIRKLNIAVGPVILSEWLQFQKSSVKKPCVMELLYFMNILKWFFIIRNYKIQKSGKYFKTILLWNHSIIS
jgi:hypothetical protein